MFNITIMENWKPAKNIKMNRIPQIGSTLTLNSSFTYVVKNIEYQSENKNYNLYVDIAYVNSL